MCEVSYAVWWTLLDVQKFFLDVQKKFLGGQRALLDV
jgi:hypothetical protein